MRSAFAILISLGCLQAIAADKSVQEIRFCPVDVALDANLELKEKVLAKVRPHNSKAGRYRPGSKLTAFLASL